MHAEGNGRWTRRGFDTSRPAGSFVEVVRGVLVEPARFFSALWASHEEEEPARAPLIFAGSCLAIGLALGFVTAPLNPLAPEGTPNPLSGLLSVAQDDPSRLVLTIVLFLVLVPIGLVLSVYLWSAIQHLFVLVFVRGRRGFRSTFLVVAYANAIVLVAWIPVLGYLLGLYGIYVVAIGLREMHGTTTARALLAALIPYLLQLAWSATALF